MSRAKKHKNKSRGRKVVILLTGGSGLLGKELLKLDSSIVAPSHSDLDITDSNSVLRAIDKYKPDVFLHAAAATKPSLHERNPALGLSSNIIGTASIALICLQKKIKLIYISSDYVYSGPGPHLENEPVFPPSKFIWSKLGGECSVSLVPDSLILRLSFGKLPYEWEKVYEGQWTSKLYVDEITPLVLMAAKSKATGVMNIGGPRTTLEDYAKRTVPNIKTIPKPEWVPVDTSLDVGRMRDTLGIKNLWAVLKHNNAEK